MYREIYLIPHVPSGHRYVGESIDTAERRWHAHVKAAREGNTQPIDAFINAHPIEEFELKVLEQMPVVALRKHRFIREAWWIDDFGTFNDVDPLGMNHRTSQLKGCKFSKASRLKTSKAAKGREPWNKGKTKKTDSRIAAAAKKMSVAKIGTTRVFTDAHRKALSDAAKRRGGLSEKTKRKISQTLKRRYVDS